MRITRRCCVENWLRTTANDEFSERYHWFEPSTAHSERPRKRGFFFGSARVTGACGPLVSAGCQPTRCSDGAKAGLGDARHEVVAVHRLVKLVGIRVERDADVLVPNDVLDANGIKAEADDQV